jgi:HK97 family phage major capsid protein
VPPEIERQIGERIFAISPIRSLASVRTISSNVYKKTSCDECRLLRAPVVFSTVE